METERQAAILLGCCTENGGNSGGFSKKKGVFCTRLQYATVVAGVLHTQLCSQTKALNLFHYSQTLFHCDILPSDSVIISQELDF